MKDINPQQVSINCDDGVTLYGTIYTPLNELKAAVLVGPATGIKRQFYSNFAQFLCRQGFAVMTFDNRGIGQSLQGSVKHNSASIVCWGEKDPPAALEFLKETFPTTQYHLVGHSAGGQLIGLMPNARDFTSFFNIACSSGSLRNMKFPFWFQAHFFMNLFIPLSNLIFGHTRSELVGMGEPLPKRVAQQWRKWCNGRGYVKTEFGKAIKTHFYEEIDIPSMWVNAVDDPIANDKNVSDMISVYSNTRYETLTLDPKENGLKEIGHMKFFSKRSQALWQHVIDWLEKF